MITFVNPSETVALIAICLTWAKSQRATAERVELPVSFVLFVGVIRAMAGGNFYRG
ncbi:hypothetical protein KCP74_06130 [Salmonella enterica subsp. enterica]|nr:hypothetical protein KCP74_06130 [Salmonella enterica subsp. enterica]